jgi:lysophospholipase L1-like esterase
MRLALLVSLLLILPVPAPAAPPERVNTAIVPRRSPLPGWEDLHYRFVALGKYNEIPYAFLGDSITADWGGPGQRPLAEGRAVFEAEFAPFGVANFGIGGDRTEHVLWRIRHGLFDHIRPKVVMLMIGSNNLYTNTASEIAHGIAAVILEMWKHSPRTKVMLMGILPRGDRDDPVRGKIARVNALIARFDDGGQRLRFLDIGAALVLPDGTIPKEIMYDSLHLTALGYSIWAFAAMPHLAGLAFTP